MNLYKYFKELNKIERMFPDKKSIDMNQVKAFINRSLGFEIESDILKRYLKEKGYINIRDSKDISAVKAVLETLPSRTEPPGEEPDLKLEPDLNQEFDADLDIDDILEMDDPEAVSDEDTRREFSRSFQRNHYTGQAAQYSYSDNTNLVKAFQETRDTAVLDTILSLNRRLVMKEVAYYLRYLSGHGVSEDDLEQEGMMGLAKAAHMFDPGKGYEFSTYASLWIKQFIMRYISNNENIVRIPIHRLEQIRKLNKCEKNLMEAHGSISIEDVCEKLGISKNLYYKLKYFDHCFVCIDSLDKYVGEEDDTRLIDLIPDESSHSSVFDQVTSRLLREDIDTLLDTLTSREKAVLKLRYGLDTGIPMTLEEVGQKYHLTRERIRQIEKKAIKKLRHPVRRKQLVDYNK
jgi:RNA polymerase primary sigma factor